MAVELTGRDLTLQQLVAVARRSERVTLGDAARRRTAEAHDLVREKIPLQPGGRGAPADPGLLRGLIRTGALGGPEAAASP